MARMPSWTMTLSVLLCMLFVTPSSTFASEPSATVVKPGGRDPALLEERLLEVTLYLATVHRQPDGVVHGTFLWIPADIEPLCLGKSERQCREIDGCQRHATGQKCNADLSHCQPVVDPTCAALGITLENWSKRRRQPGTVPYEMETSLPYHLAAATAALLRRWHVPLDFTGSRDIQVIDARRSVRAKVLWRSYENGASFEVKEFLGAPEPATKRSKAGRR